MAHLIDKDALVAKIEKRFDEYSSSILRHYDACTEARASELGKILVLLNTLEMKEVDLNEEIESYFKGFGKFPSVGIDDCIDIAQHFFELGMHVSNKAQKGEKI